MRVTSRRWWRHARWLLVLASVTLASGATALPACSSSSSSASSSGLQVVAAENFWGSIAAQLGGDKVHVTNIINSPDADPHDYEPTPSDGRAIADARLVVFDGLAYDPWAEKLLSANPASHRLVVKVQDVLGLKDDDNPHRWYSPTDVLKVIDQVTADYKKLDANNAAFYDAQKTDYVSNRLKQYLGLVQQIKQKYAGTPIGATESIVVPLADALGLKLISPPGFLQAISEGTDPTAGDKATFDSQIQQKQMMALLFNTQNATPDVQRLVDAARAKGIAIVEVTETPAPPTATFQEWQAKQLQSLSDALAKASGK